MPLTRGDFNADSDSFRKRPGGSTGQDNFQNGCDIFETVAVLAAPGRSNEHHAFGDSVSCLRMKRERSMNGSPG